MNEEVHYRLPRRVAGWRPGAHRGTPLGHGHDFIAHASLFAYADPRRLDLRASLKSVRSQVDGDWLVRQSRQQSAVTVQVFLDVSASMRFGAPVSKLAVAADVVAALGLAAARQGDAFGLCAFAGADLVDDLYWPPQHSRGSGAWLAENIRQWRPAQSTPRQATPDGLLAAFARLSAKPALLFLIADFHWPLTWLDEALAQAPQTFCVPIVIWHPAEINPPAQNGMALLTDMESGRRRALWLRPALRQHWRQAVAARRQAMHDYFAAHALQPFFVSGGFSADALTAYFFAASP